MGSFPIIRHNELRDFTASPPTEVCHNVATEPHLQPLKNGESMYLRSAITTGNAHVDICANGFWTGAQDAYFDNAGSHYSRNMRMLLTANTSDKLNTVSLHPYSFLINQWNRTRSNYLL